MIKGFVFGKYLPFHVGHEAMIRFAMTKCDLLTVLVCCSDKEDIPAHIRVGWIEKTFEGYGNIEVLAYGYIESVLPNSSVPSMHISELWARVFSQLLPDYTLLCTSEPYGDMVAGFMGIKHVAYDLDRKMFPVAASIIKKDVVANWQYLPAAVQPYYAIKVVIAGTESTGKTTLAAQLAKHYTCSLVTEAGRDVIPDSTAFVWDDLHTVAAEHAKRIKRAIVGSGALVIMDTDIHITMSYGQFMFGRQMDVDDSIYELNKGDLYLYLNNDVPYVQDGTRLEEAERDALDISHRQVFVNNGVNLVEVRGTWEERMKQAIQHIDSLLESKKL